MRCPYDHCIRKVAKIIGHCNFCDYNFCVNHRLPESHNCHQYHNCKSKAKEELEKQLYDSSNAIKKKLM